jgi:hypothetical protein
MILVNVFTHANGFIESLDLTHLQSEVQRLGLVGEYSTKEKLIDADPKADITVSTFQAKAALALVGRYDEVEAFIHLETTDRITKLKWEYSNFKRTDPSVLQIAAALGMTDQELDDLFSLAETIE